MSDDREDVRYGDYERVVLRFLSGRARRTTIDPRDVVDGVYGLDDRFGRRIFRRTTDIDNGCRVYREVEPASVADFMREAFGDDAEIEEHLGGAVTTMVVPSRSDGLRRVFDDIHNPDDDDG